MYRKKACYEKWALVGRDTIARYDYKIQLNECLLLLLRIRSAHLGMEFDR